jgi:ligand-binding SRPBCC domain-containing protein
MSFYSLKRVQVLPISVEAAWDFFSNPGNLEKITPKEMGFQITSDPQLLTPMYAGQIITYIVRPVLSIPMPWMTEIKHVKYLEHFVDEQRVGPYALWYHQHHFRAVDGGVEMTDLVHYRLPLGILGNFAHWLFVKRQLNQIFNYRYQLLETYFLPQTFTKTA